MAAWWPWVAAVEKRKKSLLQRKSAFCKWEWRIQSNTFCFIKMTLGSVSAWELTQVSSSICLICLRLQFTRVIVKNSHLAHNTININTYFDIGLPRVRSQTTGKVVESNKPTRRKKLAPMQD